MSYNVRSVSHTGVTVGDLERALRFWTGVLGFEFVASDEVGGAFLTGITGVPGAHVRAALVTKGGSTVELLQYTAPDDRKTVRPRPSDVGSVHIALEVDDVEAVAEACAGHGWVMPGRIETLAGGPLEGAKFVYLFNDDGTALELVQLPAA